MSPPEKGQLSQLSPCLTPEKRTLPRDGGG